jgi:cyclic pyranopterin phosphate synthase
VDLNNKLKDSFARTAKKLRISVTDRCNMRCIYCMPANNVDWFEQQNILSFQEINRVVTILADLGIVKVRLTGGEPLLRPKIPTLINLISQIPQIEDIGMTTNGIGLQANASGLKGAGLRSVNVSLDTLKENRFKAINGVNGLDNVLDGIKVAADVGLRVKLNMVVIRGWNDDEVVEFAELSKKTNYTVRFIEFMPLDGTSMWNNHLVVTKAEIIKKLGSEGIEIFPLHNDYSEPARLFTFNDKQGSLGFIPSISEPFCTNCDRIRLTSDGRLLTCLYEKPGTDLKGLLRSKKSDQVIKLSILNSINFKPEGIIRLIRTKSLRPTMNLMHRIGG